MNEDTQQKGIQFEHGLKLLEDIAAQMEKPETGLEKSLTLYKEGIELALGLSEKLSKVEAEVTTLSEQAGKIFER